MSALTRLVASAAARLGGAGHLRPCARAFDARWRRSFSATDGGDGEDDDADETKGALPGDGEDRAEDASVEASHEGAGGAGDDGDGATREEVAFRT